MVKIKEISIAKLEKVLGALRKAGKQIEVEIITKDVVEVYNSYGKLLGKRQVV